jgi:hypothetical protein
VRAVGAAGTALRSDAAGPAGHTVDAVLLGSEPPPDGLVLGPDDGVRGSSCRMGEVGNIVALSHASERGLSNALYGTAGSGRDASSDCSVRYESKKRNLALGSTFCRVSWLSAASFNVVHCAARARQHLPHSELRCTPRCTPEISRRHHCTLGQRQQKRHGARLAGRTTQICSLPASEIYFDK